MGMEVGYNVISYTKKDGKYTVKLADLTEAQKDRTWCGGRSELSYAWGSASGLATEDVIQDGKEEIAVIPTFSKELDGIVVKNFISSECQEIKKVKFKYINYDDFKAEIEETIHRITQQYYETSYELTQKVYASEQDIESYRKLQLRCKKENEFAFDKFQQIVEEKLADLYELKLHLSNLAEEDDEYSRVKIFKRLLEDMLQYTDPEHGQAVALYYSY